MKVLAKNRRATFDYAIEDKLVAGISLLGNEVKSVKDGNISLKGSYVNISSGEAFLIGAHITPYQKSETDPERSRKLLLHRSQIKMLHDKRESGLNTIPLAVLEQKGLIKIEIGIGRGKKRYDKRETLKKRQTQRETEKKLKSS